MTEGPYKLPEGWRWVRLGEVIESISNGTTAKQNKDGRGVPVTRMETISNEEIDTSRIGYIENACENLIKKYKLKYGDILFSHINSDPHLGKTAIYRGQPQLLLHGMNLLRIVPKRNKIEPEFLNFVFKNYRNFGVFISIAQRAIGQSSINQRKMKMLPTPLPPLPEQRRIVARIEELMARVREARRLRQQAREDAERLWQSVLAETFPRPGSDLPQGWRWVRLGEVAETKMGGTPSTKVSEYWEPPEVVWITPEDLNKNTLTRVFTSRRFISRVGLENSSAKLFPARTVLLSTTATIGKVGIAEKELSANQQISGIICKGVNPDFLAYYLLGLGEVRLKQLGGTATATHINQKSLRTLPIPLPPLSEQRRIVAHLGEVRERIQTLKKAQEDTEARLEDLERSILDKSFRGEL